MFPRRALSAGRIVGLGATRDFHHGLPAGGKRLFDVIAASALLVGLSPLAGMVALAVWLGHGSPILLRQRRPGLHTAPFTLFKFRTMTDAVDPAGHPLRDAERITPLGAFLRATSLDELPELMNVIRGEMSLVGPRPLLMRYLEHFTPAEQVRHTVRPGITGLAQTSGRNRLNWDARLALDVWYVEHWSFGLDVKILCRTVGAVLTRRDAVVDATSVMPDLDAVREHRGGR